MSGDSPNPHDPAGQVKSRSRKIHFRNCEIWFCGDQLVIDSLVPLPDLILREFARPRVFFERTCYYLSEKSQSSSQPPIHRYVLTPWPAQDTAHTNEINLDEAYFQNLADTRRLNRRDETLYKVLILIYPLLGFVWSRPKRNLGRIGFELHALGSTSVFVSFMIGVVCAVFLVIQMFGGRVFQAGLCAGLVVFMLDSIMRFDRLLREKDEIPLGFYEWLWPPKPDQ